MQITNYKRKDLDKLYSDAMHTVIHAYGKGSIISNGPWTLRVSNDRVTLVCPYCQNIDGEWTSHEHTIVL